MIEAIDSPAIACATLAWMDRARVITVLNRKGGVGKTHLCWLTASVAAEQKKRTLVVDLDPQGNISTSLLPGGFEGQAVEELFREESDIEIRSLIRPSWYPCIDILPSTPRLEAVNLPNPREWEAAGLELTLAEALSQIAAEYDYIILDCPPSLALTSVAALSASDFVLVPLEAAHWGALGTQHIRAAIDHIRQRSNSRLELLGYVISRYKVRRTYQKSHLHQLQAHFGDDAFQTAIPDLATFEKSVTDKIPICIHSRSSHAARIAREFFTELETRCDRIERKRSRGRRGSVLDPAVSHTE